MDKESYNFGAQCAAEGFSFAEFIDQYNKAYIYNTKGMESAKAGFSGEEFEEQKKMKELSIDWLGKCPNCNNEKHLVKTALGKKDWLYEGDAVTCRACGKRGEIESIEEGVVCCAWDEEDSNGSFDDAM